MSKLKKFFESVDASTLGNPDIQAKLAELVESTIAEIKAEKDACIEQLKTQLSLQEADFQQTEKLVCEQLDTIVKKLNE